MVGEIDPFDFFLAEGLGMSLAQVHALPNAEYVAWRAFYVFRHAMQNMTEAVPRRRH